MFDLSLPGYKYLGPFNPMDKGEPMNYNDWVAYWHDINYGKIIEKGGNPYLYWSEADAQAYRSFTYTDYGGALGSSYFGLKKAAYALGLIDKVPSEKEDNIEYGVSTNGNSFSNLPNTEHMPSGLEMKRMRGEDDSPLSEIKLAGGENVPVKPHAPSYGLQDTHTTILPQKIIFSNKGEFSDIARTFRICVNSIYDNIQTTIESTDTGVWTSLRTAIPEVNATGSTTALAELDPGSLRSTYPQPTGGTNATSTAEKLWYRDWFGAFYKSYSVIGCEVSLTVQNVGRLPGDNISIGWLEFSDDTKPPTTRDGTNGFTVHYFDAWKNTKRIVLKNNERRTITHMHSPGDEHHHALELQKIDTTNNVVQSDTWTQVTKSPNHKEYIEFYFFVDPVIGLKNFTGHANIELNLKYKVQFRDLVKNLEYPTGANASAYYFPTTSIYSQGTNTITEVRAPPAESDMDQT